MLARLGGYGQTLSSEPSERCGPLSTITDLTHPLPAARVAFRPLAAALAVLLLEGAALASGDKADGRRLARFLDSLQVEDRWPAGVHVDWETGLPDGKVEHFEGKHTHCSAFVASAAKQLGVYILRPPEHGQTLLANAQFDWLRDHGAEFGWRAAPDGYEAQRAANRGYLVVVTYKNHSPDKPGHIAIVRPSGRSREEILADGPEIIQAGRHNYTSTTLRRGFADHPAALGRNEVAYYEHELP